MRFFIVVIAGLFFIPLFSHKYKLFASDNRYDISNIADSLRKNSNSVVRRDETTFTSKSPRSAILEVVYVISVLNEEGLEDSYLIHYYNKFSSIIRIRASIYDANGNFVRKLAKDEILDYSAVSGYSLYDDTRVVYINTKDEKVPFTVEYSYEISYAGILSWPRWQPIKTYNQAVEHSVLSVVVTSSEDMRYYTSNLNSDVIITKENSNIKYTWADKNLKALLLEPYSTYLSEFTPFVLTAPSSFEIGGTTGNMDSWENLGSWINDLAVGQDNLSVETINDILSVAQSCSTDLEKVEKIYQYFQNKTRYVSIQIGLGGWQPTSADVVDRLLYGDCKALTNYMKSLLKIAGIPSVYTWVKAGSGSPIIPDFPSVQFNHAFLCVPMKGDTVWLECTSQQIPFGYTGAFTNDKKVLLCEEGKSRIVSSNKLPFKDNFKHTVAEVFIEPNGNGKAKITTIYNGLFYDDVIGIFYSNTDSRQKLLCKSIAIPNFKVVNSSYAEKRQIIPSVEEVINLDLINYGVITGNKILLTLNLLNKTDKIVEDNDGRRSKIMIPKSGCEIDSVWYNMPAGYVPSELPGEVKVVSEFGSFSAKTVIFENKLLFVRELTMKQGLYPKEKFEDFRKFNNEISKADKTKCLIVRNE